MENMMKKLIFFFVFCVVNFFLTAEPVLPTEIYDYYIEHRNQKECIILIDAINNTKNQSKFIHWLNVSMAFDCLMNFMRFDYNDEKAIKEQLFKDNKMPTEAPTPTTEKIS